MENKRKVILYTAEDINSKVKELGGLIKKDYADKNLLVVSLLKGSFIFAADLVRNIDLPVVVEFMTTSSYGDGFEGSANVKIEKDIERDLTKFDVLIVDDIIDSGYTMDFVIKHLKQKGVKSIKSCTLLDKPSRRQIGIDADYTGYKVDDLFIVGYGLNYGDYYRNIPYIFAFED